MPNVPIPDDLLDDIFKSNASGGGVYLDRCGKYEILIEAQFYRLIPKVGRCFITKGQVVASEKLVVQEPPTKAHPEGRSIEEEPHPAGYRFSYTLNKDGKAAESFEGNAKALVLSVFGMSDVKVTEAEFKSTFKDMISDAQPTRGFVIGAEVRPKGAGKDKATRIFDHAIRLPYWQCLGVPGQGKNTADLVRARRADVDKYIAADLARDEETFDGATAGANGSAAPPLPGAPALPGDPLAGWTFNPGNAAGDPDPYYYKGSDQKRRSQIVAGR